jgi:hypothetical protein
MDAVFALKVGADSQQWISDPNANRNVGDTNLDQILVYDNLSSIVIGESWNAYVPFGTSITIGSQEVASLTSDRVGMNEAIEASTGYGRWGFTYEQGLDLREGDEVWFRVFELMPVGYDHYAYGEGNRLKWMRAAVVTIIGGTNGGYNDVYFDNEDNLRFMNIKEASTDSTGWIPFANYPSKNYYADGQWHSYEMYIKFSKNPSDGKVRFWVDGQPMGESTRATLNDPEISGAGGDYHCNRLLYHTYWNGGTPKTQRCYYDNIAIAIKKFGGRNDEPWLAIDTNGNRFIGSAVQ